MAASKAAALPLGDAPTIVLFSILECLFYIKGVGFMLMRFVIFLFLFVFFPSAAFAESGERLLTGSEVTSWLSDSSVTSESWSQTFSANGDTTYITAERPPSTGKWRVQGSQYCSLWPPAGDWACYDVFGEETDSGRIITWVSSSGYRESARIDP